MPDYLRQILHTQLFAVLNILIGFATLIMLIKHMPIIDYADYILIQGFMSIAGLVVSQNLYAYTRLHIPGATSLKQYSYLKTILLVVFGTYISIIVLIKAFDIEHILIGFLELNEKLIYPILLMLGFYLINNEFMRFFIAVKKVQINNYTQFLQKIFLFISILLLVFLSQLTLKLFLYFYILGQLFIFIFFIYHLNIMELIKSHFMADLLQKGYKVALPLLPIGMLSIALNYTDTIMIAKFIGKEYAAQYGFASQIINIATMLIGGSITLTLFSYATEAHNINNIELRTSFFLKMYIYGVCLSLLFYLVSIINIEWLITLFDLSKYNKVPEYLSVLAVFPFFRVLYSVSSHHMQLIKIFKLQVYIAITIMLENTILNYYMIQAYGTMGAAYASLISYISLSILFFSASFYKDTLLFNEIKKNLFKIIVIILVAFIMLYIFGFSGLLLNTIHIVIGNIFVITGILVYLIYFKNGRFR